MRFCSPKNLATLLAIANFASLGSGSAFADQKPADAMNEIKQFLGVAGDSQFFEVSAKGVRTDAGRSDADASCELKISNQIDSDSGEIELSVSVRSGDRQLGFVAEKISIEGNELRLKQKIITDAGEIPVIDDDTEKRQLRAVKILPGVYEIEAKKTTQKSISWMIPRSKKFGCRVTTSN